LTATQAEQRASTWTFLPGIEGLRGLAVAAVLLFHGGFSWAKGGFLGVSTFFTLSGFLITSLLLREHEAGRGIGLKRFWTRRFRRLMPAALATIALAAVYLLVAGDAVQKRSFGGDTIATLAYVANWHFLFSHQSYSALFSQPSPLLHFWSLAIEEQFYLLYPLLCVGVLVVWKSGRRQLGLALAALTAVSVAIMAFGHLSMDAVYYGTETRAAELLIGGLLAVVVDDRRLARLTAERTSRTWLLATVGVAGLAATITCWVVVPQTASWLYQGGFALYAVGSAAVLLGAMVAVGPVRAVLASRPLRALGLISYGVYLYHWPIFLWISPGNLGGTSTTVLFVPRVVVTLVLAVVSYRFLELPIRRGVRPLGIRPLAIAPVVIAVLAVGALLISSSTPVPASDFTAQQARLGKLPTKGGGHVVDKGPAVPSLPRMTVFGDSTALRTALGLGEVLEAQHLAQPIGGDIQLGCAVARAHEALRAGAPLAIPRRCDWTTRWPAEVRASGVQLVVVQFGPWDIEPQRIPGDSVYRTPGDPVYDAWLQKELVAAVDALSSNGAIVVWLTSPDVGNQARASGDPDLTDLVQPARMAAFNDLVKKLPSLRPGKVQVVDLAGWMADKVDDTRLRPDGVHFTEGTARQVSSEYLAAAVMAAFASAWKTGHS
jgi:peptidoglycan/LPS O-acetylase OafA/YrhL